MFLISHVSIALQYYDEDSSKIIDYGFWSIQVQHTYYQPYCGKFTKNCQVTHSTKNLFLTQNSKICKSKTTSKNENKILNYSGCPNTFDNFVSECFMDAFTICIRKSRSSQQIEPHHHWRLRNPSTLFDILSNRLSQETKKQQ